MLNRKRESADTSLNCFLLLFYFITIDILGKQWIGNSTVEVGEVRRPRTDWLHFKALIFEK